MLCARKRQGKAPDQCRERAVAACAAGLHGDEPTRLAPLSLPPSVGPRREFRLEPTQKLEPGQVRSRGFWVWFFDFFFLFALMEIEVRQEGPGVGRRWKSSYAGFALV